MKSTSIRIQNTRMYIKNQFYITVLSLIFLITKKQQQQRNTDKRHTRLQALYQSNMTVIAV